MQAAPEHLMPEDMSEKVAYEPLTKLMEEVLVDKTDRVMVSSRITDSPCALAKPEQGQSGEQARPTMEINPQHPIMLELKKKATTGNTDETVHDSIGLLFDTSLLESGFNLDEPTQAAGRIHRMIKLGLSIDDGDDSIYETYNAEWHQSCDFISQNFDGPWGTELDKGGKDRDFRLGDIKTLSVKLESFEAKDDELEAEIEQQQQPQQQRQLLQQQQEQRGAGSSGGDSGGDSGCAGGGSIGSTAALSREERAALLVAQITAKAKLEFEAQLEAEGHL